MDKCTEEPDSDCETLGASDSESEINSTDEDNANFKEDKPNETQIETIPGVCLRGSLITTPQQHMPHHVYDITRSHSSQTSTSIAEARHVKTQPKQNRHKIMSGEGGGSGQPAKGNSGPPAKNNEKHDKKKVCLKR